MRWLHETGRKHIVGSRESRRTFDHDKIMHRLISRSGNDIGLYLDDTVEPGKNKLEGEIRVRFVSAARRAKDSNVISTRREGYEKGLRTLDGRLPNLVHPRSAAYVMRRLGILDGKYGVSSHYEVKIIKGVDGPDGHTAVGMDFIYKPVSLSKADKPGVYALRTNVKGIDPKEIVEACFQLIEIEEVFRRLKSELCLRPNFHRVEERILSRMFVTVLAYQGVNWIRSKIRAAGIRDSWTTIEDNLMDVNCAAALSKEADKADSRGLLLPEVIVKFTVMAARNYFKALGMGRPIKASPGR